jgi:hypothetical protein
MQRESGYGYFTRHQTNEFACLRELGAIFGAIDHFDAPLTASTRRTRRPDVALGRGHACVAGLPDIPRPKTLQQGACARGGLQRAVHLVRRAGLALVRRAVLAPPPIVRRAGAGRGRSAWQRERPNVMGPWSSLVCRAVPNGAAVGITAIARHGEPCREPLGVRAADPCRFAFEGGERRACGPTGSRGALGCSSVVDASFDRGWRLRCGVVCGLERGGWCRAGAHQERTCEPAANVRVPHESTVAPASTEAA